MAGTNDAFTTASYIISKPLKVKGDNNSILSPNATNILPGNSYATYLNEYKHWFVGTAIEIEKVTDFENIREQS